MVDSLSYCCFEISWGHHIILGKTGLMKYHFFFLSNRHRISDHGHESHSVTLGRKADTVYTLSRNTFVSVIRSTMSLAHRLGTAAIVAVIASIGMSPAAEAHKARHHRHHHTHVVYKPTTRKVVVTPAPRTVHVHSHGHGSPVNVRVGVRFNL